MYKSVFSLVSRPRHQSDSDRVSSSVRQRNLHQSHSASMGFVRNLLIFALPTEPEYFQTSNKSQQSPLFKNSEDTQFINYRLISLLHVFSQST